MIMHTRTILALFVAGTVLAAGAWYLFNPRAAHMPAAQTNATTTSEQMIPAAGFGAATGTAEAAQGPLLPPRQAPAGQKEYRNTAYRFSLFYPEDLTVQSFDEGNGASTITFENDKTVQGFQIFIVPYSAPQVSTERFKKDEPSGVMQQPLPLAIDGANATAFFGSDQVLGPTREVWMIHGGYLFEISAPQSLDDWLGNIMLTWKFI